MSKYLIILLLFPAIVFANEETKSIVDEVNFSITRINGGYSKSKNVDDSLNFGIGSAISLFKRIKDNNKLYAGVSANYFKAESDNFEQIETGAGIHAGFRNIKTTKIVDYFIDYQLNLGYQKYRNENFGFNGSVNETKTKIISLSLSIGKSVPISERHAIEGKFGMVVNYLNNENGWQSHFSAPSASLAWSYKLD